MRGFEGVEDVGAGEPVSKRNAQKLRDPNDRHTIRRAEIAEQQRLAKVRIKLADNQKVQIRSRDKKRRLPCHRRIETLQDFRHFDHIDRNAEDAVYLARYVGPIFLGRNRFGLMARRRRSKRDVASRRHLVEVLDLTRGSSHGGASRGDADLLGGEPRNNADESTEVPRWRAPRVDQTGLFT